MFYEQKTGWHKKVINQRDIKGLIGQSNLLKILQSQKALNL